MDTLTVVIQMTGLLLLAPENPSGRGPAHVLVPAATNLPTHLAWMAFTADSMESVNRCQFYISGLCIIDLDGWSLQLGGGAGPHPPANTIPPSALNLTRGKGRPIHRDRFGDRPGRKVRSRVSLLAGGVTDTCALADWQYDDPDTAKPPETVRLANMVEWTIPGIPQKVLPMVLRPLDPDSGDVPVTLPALRAGVRDTAEIFISHVPFLEAAQFVTALAKFEMGAGDVPEGIRTQINPEAVHVNWAERLERVVGHGMQTDPDTATHFHAYYDLLRAPKTPAARPLPHSPKRLGRTCTFTTRTQLGVRELFGLDTLSCMVASAEPQ